MNDKEWLKIFNLRDLVYDMDIPSPTIPEYIEHHRDITKILEEIDLILKEKV